MWEITAPSTDNLKQRNIRTRYCRNYQVNLVNGLLDNPLATLGGLLRDRKALLVTRSPVDRLYAENLQAQLAAGGISVPMLVLDCSEKNKSLQQVERVCREAHRLQLDRRAVLVCLGGGVCMDIVTVAASWIRRGIGYICLPTTLVSQIDASIGIKGAVNFQGKKSYLGTFYPPESVLIDPAFLGTLPQRHLSAGLSEIYKMALVRDERLFTLVETHGSDLLVSAFSNPRAESREIIWRAVERMLEELEPNIYEDQTYKRLVDFGHTFSPLLEAASGFRLEHGEAVAIDMALSALLSAELGYLPQADCDRILTALEDAGLPVYSPLLTDALCLRAVEEAVQHRAGSVNLVIPTGIGEATFLERSAQLTVALFKTCLQKLSARHSGHPYVVSERRQCLVYDIGGTTMRAALYEEESGELRQVLTRKTPSNYTRPDAGTAEIYDDLLAEVKAMGRAVCGRREADMVGIAFPGPVTEKGHALAAPTVFGRPLEAPLNLKNDLQNIWPAAQVAVLNDVSAAGYRYLQDERENFCIITVGSGIGNKIFVSGRPVTGSATRGGEIGHIRVDQSDDALPCDCGGRGHLGGIASGRGTLASAQRLAKQDREAYKRSQLYEIVSGDADRITNEHIVSAYRSGDAWTEALICRVAQPLAQVMAGIHLGLGIERFVIYGGFALALGEKYRHDLVSALSGAAWNMGQPWDSMVELGRPDDFSGMIGAGRYLLEFHKNDLSHSLTPEVRHEHCAI